MERKTKVIVAAVATIAATTVTIPNLILKPNKSTPTITVPAVIPSDCSRNVSPDLTNFLNSVPDGSNVQFVPNGCYSLNTMLLLDKRNNLTIDGEGSTFKRLTPSNESQTPPPSASNNPMWRTEGGSNITLQNMTIIGNYVPVTRGTPGQGIYTDHGISVQGTNGESILNVTIKNIDGDLVAVDPNVEVACAQFGCDYSKAPPSQNVLVDHLTGSGAGRQCVSSTDVDGFTLQNSTLDNCQQTGYDGEIDVVGEVDRNVKILNNTITNVYFAPISIPVLSYPGLLDTVKNIQISGNTIPHHYDTCYGDIYIGTDPTTSATGIVISDNNFATVGDGITMAATNTEARISNNTIKYEGNGACNNTNFTPPYSTPVRVDLTKNPKVVADKTNTWSGFCCNQDQVGVTTSTTTAPATTVPITTTTLAPLSTTTTTAPRPTTTVGTVQTTTTAAPTTTTTNVSSQISAVLQQIAALLQELNTLMQKGF